MAATESGDFLELSRALRGEIERALGEFSAFGEGCPARLSQAISHSLMAPGKRLRPMLVLMSAEACGSSRGQAMPAACAVEMIHTYSLIHDDLPAMDDDDIRRGRPSCHAAFGEAAAILAGDALQARAFELLARQVQPADVAVQCVAVLAAAAGAEALVGGQTDDLDAEHQSGGIEQLESIHRRKTGALFCASLKLGGLVGRASPEEHRALENYGRNVGLAFQIVDDLLDFQGNEIALAKRAHRDQSRGKLTFPGLLGVDESARRAQQLTEEAIDGLDAFSGRAAGLEALARYVVERTRKSNV